MSTRPSFSDSMRELSRPRDRLTGQYVDGSTLARYLFLRALGFVYAVAFLGALLQLRPLLGRNGLLPVHLFLERVEAAAGSSLAAYLRVPNLLWIDSSDGFMLALAWIGLALSILLLCGHASAPQMLALWMLYSSFVNAGQLFYSYGWEVLLLETGFLAVFLCPLTRGAWRPENRSTDRWVLFLLRWLLFRVMFGAGLIKLRGDPCWQDLTCLLYHFETQPIPNPLSWYLHQLPKFLHQAGVLFNHAAELIAPWLLFGPRRARHAGALLIVAFQVLLIVSGNLLWFNYLALALCIACLDDGLLRRIIPDRLRLSLQPVLESADPRRSLRASKARRITVYALVLLVAVLSVNPVANMLSSRQLMNTSFDRLNLVNTYGAFGGIGKVRREVIILGTRDPAPGDETEWREYEFKCKPGDPLQRPCAVSPYHHRVDWQIWFAAMTDYRRQPWFVHLAYKLLLADQEVLGLLAADPFDGRRPTYIRADLYEYEFTEPGAESWWRRHKVGTYLPALSKNNPALLDVLRSFGWPVEKPGLLAMTTDVPTHDSPVPPCRCAGK